MPIQERSQGGRGGSSPPIGLCSMQNRTFLVVLRPIFCEKLKIAPPVEKQPSPQTFGFPIWAEKSVPISVKTFFFWRSPDFEPKKRLNLRFRPKNQSQFR